MRQASLNLEAVQSLAAALGVDSMAELSRRTGIERSYLSRILRGDRPAKPSHIVKLAEALKVAPMALLGPADPGRALDEVAAGDDDVEAVVA